MTDTDLATLLRQDVAASEPHHHLDPRVPVRLGRRRLRSRRLRAAGAAAALVAVAGVVVPLATAGDHEAAPAQRPAGDQVRDLLEPSTGALDAPSTAVGPIGTTFTFGNRQGGIWHVYRVTNSTTAAPEDPAEHCRVAMEERGYVSCAVERGPDGATAIVQVLAVVPVGEVPADHPDLGPVGDNSFARMPLNRLDDVDPRDVFFRREVLVATPTGTVSVNEQVNVGDQDTAEATYVIPVGALIQVAGELATHPEVFPTN